MSHTVFEGAPTRSEKISITLKLNKSKVDKHKVAVATLVNSCTPNCPNFTDTVKKDDTVSLTYEFNAFYFGNVELNLLAILELLEDPEVIISADIQELIRGESLLVSVIEKMQTVRQKLESRNNTVSST